VIVWYFPILLLEADLAHGRLTNDFLSERILTGDRVTIDSLVGIRLLAEMGRTGTVLGHDYLQVLNHQAQLWRDKAEKLAEARATLDIPGPRKKKDRRQVDCL